jgi:hypothetical protein
VREHRRAGRREAREALMAKTVGGLNDDGRVYKHKVTRGQKKSEREIPWTPGPTTKRAKIARALWG